MARKNRLATSGSGSQARTLVTLVTNTPRRGSWCLRHNEIIVEVCVPLYWPAPDIYKFSFISKINIVMSKIRIVFLLNHSQFWNCFWVYGSTPVGFYCSTHLLRDAPFRNSRHSKKFYWSCTLGRAFGVSAYWLIRHAHCKNQRSHYN